jgi:hypothetical protein
VISRCELETTQRVAFRVDGALKQAIASVVRISLFGKNRAWLADEMVFDTKGDVPILSIAGLLDARSVTAVKRAYDGYVDSMDQSGMVSGGDSATGRKACAQRDGLDIAGGPDVQIDTIVFGRTWILARLYLDINHFFANQETNESLRFGGQRSECDARVLMGARWHLGISRCHRRPQRVRLPESLLVHLQGARRLRRPDRLGYAGRTRRAIGFYGVSTASL